MKGFFSNACPEFNQLLYSIPNTALYLLYAENTSLLFFLLIGDCRSNIKRILPRLPAITDTLNAVLLNHQWLYFPSSIDDPNFDTASVRTTTPSVFSILRAKFGYWGSSSRSDAVSMYSVETSTTTRERIDRNQDALEIDTMIQKFQETAAGTKAVGYTAAIPDPAELAWRMKADRALIVLMHWAYRAQIGLEPFLNYHFSFPHQAQTQKAQWLNKLPVPGYVNLIKSIWILTTLDLKRGDLGRDLGDEGKALVASLACVCLLCVSGYYIQLMEGHGVVEKRILVLQVSGS